MNDEDAVLLARARECIEKFIDAHLDNHPVWALAAALGSEAAALVLELASQTGRDYEECKRAYLASLSDVFDLLIKGVSADLSRFDSKVN